MPSKYGFGNTRKKSPHKLVSYGGDQKNPIKGILQDISLENLLDPGGFFGGSRRSDLPAPITPLDAACIAPLPIPNLVGDDLNGKALGFP